MLGSFILTSFLIELTPGPNMTYLAGLAATRGRKAGLVAVAGVALGLLINGTAAALGLATLITNSPTAYELLRWTGVLFLLWLAFDAWRGGGDVPDAQADAADSWGKLFRQGLMTNVLNPKAGAFYIAVLPTFIAPAAPSLFMETILLTLVYVGIATLVHAGIVLLASTLQRALSRPERTILVQRGFALSLAFVALWFALETQR